MRPPKGQVQQGALTLDEARQTVPQTSCATPTAMTGGVHAFGLPRMGWSHADRRSADIEDGGRWGTGRKAHGSQATRGVTTGRRCPAATDLLAPRHCHVHGTQVSSGLMAVLLVCCGFSLTAESAFKAPGNVHVQARKVLAGGSMHGNAAAFMGLPAAGLGTSLPSMAGAVVTPSAFVCLKSASLPGPTHAPGNTLLGPALLSGGGPIRRRRSVGLFAHAGGFERQSLARKPMGGILNSQEDEEKESSLSSAHEMLGEVGALSAQERRMLRILSRFGKVEGPVETQSAKTAAKKGSGKTTGFAIRRIKEEGDEMAKDRREEKLALRRQGSVHAEKNVHGKGPHAAGSKATGPASSKKKAKVVLSRSKSKTRLDAKTAVTREKRDASPGTASAHAQRSVSLDSKGHCMHVEKETEVGTKMRRPNAARSISKRGCEANGRPNGSRFSVKHAAVRTNGALKRSLPSAPVHPCKSTPIPHNLAHYTSLAALLDVLEPFCKAAGYGKGCRPASCCSVDGPSLSASSVSDAVGALNRLKRLRNQATNKQLEMRLSDCMECLSVLVLDGMPLLSGKLVSLVINAVAHTRRHSRLLSAAGKRAVEIALSDGAGALDVQAVSVILNGFARAGMRDLPLCTTMSAVAIRLLATNSSDFGAQAISVIANAFAKLRVTDEVLFAQLARRATEVPASDYTPQAIANIMNAYARHDALDEELFRFLSTVSRKSVPSQWLSRHLALVVNALAKLDHRDDDLLAWIAEAVLARPASSFDVQAIANILNGYAKIYGHGMDRQLLAHMSNALCQIADASPRMLDPLSIASSLNAMVKTGYRDDGRRLLKKLSYVTMQLDPLLFDAQSVSTIMHSLAKLEWRDQKLFRKLATVVGQMEFILEPQSIALIINACAKVEYHDMKLMKHISRIACSLPADTFTPQHVENVLNGFARLEVRDRTLFLHMAEVVQALPAEEFDSQAVAIILNSFARAMPQDPATAGVFRYLAHQVLPHLATVDLQATSLSIILNAFAKAEIRDDEAIARLCSMIVADNGVLLSGGTGGIPVRQFDGRHIASVLHALATLHVERPPILDDLLDHLLRCKPEEESPEEVAIIAWSVAVLDLEREDVYDWLMRGLDHHLTNLEANFRRQVHQFLLTCELNGFLAHEHDSLSHGAPASRPLAKQDQGREGDPRGSLAEGRIDNDRRLRYADEVLADYGAMAGNHRSSRLQRDVAGILAEMRIGFVEEYVDEKSGYSVDIVLSDKRTAIEVDGPSHYAAGSHRPLGNTNMKHRHLAQLGFDLRILPYWEWDELTSKEEKMAYIRQLLTSTPSASLS